MRSIKELATEALNVQDACNLSGVVHSFSRVLSDLREHLSKEPNFSTNKLNTHPISVLFSSKVASLTGSESAEEFSRAIKLCEELSSR